MSNFFVFWFLVCCKNEWTDDTQICELRLFLLTFSHSRHCTCCYRRVQRWCICDGITRVTRPSDPKRLKEENLGHCEGVWLWLSTCWWKVDRFANAAHKHKFGKNLKFDLKVAPEDKWKLPVDWDHLTSRTRPNTKPYWTQGTSIKTITCHRWSGMTQVDHMFPAWPLCSSSLLLLCAQCPHRQGGSWQHANRLRLQLTGPSS